MYSYRLLYSSAAAGETHDASVVDDTGTPLDPQPTPVINDLGAGAYLYVTVEMPDGQGGAVVITNSGTLVSGGVVSPAETEGISTLDSGNQAVLDALENMISGSPPDEQFTAHALELAPFGVGGGGGGSGPLGPFLVDFGAGKTGLGPLGTGSLSYLVYASDLTTVLVEATNDGVIESPTQPGLYAIPTLPDEALGGFIEWNSGDTLPKRASEAISVSGVDAMAVADAILTRDFSAVTSPDESVRCLLQAARYLRNKVAAPNGVLTVYREDDVTADWTAVATTDAAAIPIVSRDPTG